MIKVVVGNTNGDEFVIDDACKEKTDGDVYQLFDSYDSPIFLMSVSNIAYRYYMKDNKGIKVQKKGGL